MDRLAAILSVLDRSLSTKSRRHLTGGVLMSISLLFGGLAVTVMSLKTEENKHEQYIE